MSRAPMNFAVTPEQTQTRDTFEKVCEYFNDEYWLEKDTRGGFIGARKYLGERYPRKSLIGCCARLARNVCLCLIAENMLGRAKSY